jgi:hypothetical protein
MPRWVFCGKPFGWHAVPDAELILFALGLLSFYRPRALKLRSEPTAARRFFYWSFSMANADALRIGDSFNFKGQTYELVDSADCLLHHGLSRELKPSERETHTAYNATGLNLKP